MILDFFTNKPLMTAIAAWAIAQLLKVVITSIMERRLNLGCIFASGGMPSSHSAFVTSMCVVIGTTYGFGSEIFAVAAAFALVVMYDACGVRRAVGEQAKVLNKIIKTLNEKGDHSSEEALKEILGHSPFQVVMGWVLGMAVGIAAIMI